jgi:hypothetical protein
MSVKSLEFIIIDFTDFRFVFMSKLNAFLFNRKAGEAPTGLKGARFR